MKSDKGEQYFRLFEQVDQYNRDMGEPELTREQIEEILERTKDMVYDDIKKIQEDENSSPEEKMRSIEMITELRYWEDQYLRMKLALMDMAEGKELSDELRQILLNQEIDYEQSTAILTDEEGNQWTVIGFEPPDEDEEEEDF